jgi:ubiquinone/menaquinone biosynthesis methyltransferase
MTGVPIADVRARHGEEVQHETAARGMFERIAPTYDLLNRVLSVGIDGHWRTRAVGELKSAPPGPVLDLCAGTMDLSALVAAERPRDRLVAVDFSPGMLEAGSRKAPGAQVVVADALSLPFENSTFAAVICGFGMRNLADVSRGVREVVRVLRPGGVFVTLELFRPVRATARAFHRAYASVVLPTLGGLVSGDRGAYSYLARSMKGFLVREDYEQLLRDCGFARVTGHDLTLGVASIVRAEAAA